MYIIDVRGEEGKWKRDATAAELGAAPLSTHYFAWLGEILYTWPDLRSLLLGCLTVQLEKLAQYMFLRIYVLYQQGYFIILGWGEQSKYAGITKPYIQHSRKQFYPKYSAF